MCGFYVTGSKEGVALTQQVQSHEHASPRVVHVIAPAPYGGAESVVTALAAAAPVNRAHNLSVDPEPAAEGEPSPVGDP